MKPNVIGLLGATIIWLVVGLLIFAVIFTITHL